MMPSKSSLAKSCKFVAAACLLSLAAAAPAAAQTKLLRFPDIHKDRVAFVYAGNIWTAPAKGGTASKVTSHPGLELFPKFSPDGKWIAFTGQYDGDEQVYVVPSAGGVPQQLTYYPARGPLPDRWGYDNQVYGWTPDGKAVLFRSMRDGWTLTDTRLFTVPVKGGLPEPLPMPVSGAGDLSPDGKQVAYTPLTRDFRTWKRYQGGWAQDLYIFDLASHELTQITNHPRTDRDPMWIGDRVYFASDRDGKLNLYAYDIESKETEQVTHEDEFDVRWPSEDEKRGKIVYELNGELQVLDTESGEAKKIEISVPDDGLSSRPRHVDVQGMVEDFDLSPDGKRAVFTARGDIFTAPAENGVTRNLTRSSGAHDKWAAWSPDGKYIAYISDASGEEEIYLVDQKGGEPRQLTGGGQAMRYSPRWSPDSKHIAFSDKDGKLYLLNVASKTQKEIADEARGQLLDYSWSPCGGHLAFSLSDESDFRSLYIYSLQGGELRRVTDEPFNEHSPTWDPDGNYLFYLSDRMFAPQIGSFEWNYIDNRVTGIFALALRKDVKNLFAPKSDEVEVKEEKKEEKKKDEQEKDGGSGEEKKQDEDKDGKKDDKKEEKTNEKEPTKIDFDGLASRVARVPVEPDNYGGLSASKGHLIYVRGTPFYYGRQPEQKSELRIYSLNDRKEETLAEGVGGYALSQDGNKLLVREGGSFNLYDAKPGGKGSKKAVSTSGLAVDLVPQEEWDQIFNEIWRRYRDFFYVTNMHGYDWEALREQYRPLLKHVSHRSDLNYVIGEMISELNVGHAYNTGGDIELPERPRVALPGARFELDKEAGRYRISKIFAGQNEEPKYRSPLTEVGLDVKVGDYVLAIDGEELAADDNPYRLLRFKADRPVALRVNDKPQEEGSREIVFTPLASETDLAYLAWTNANRRRVAELTDGKVGYLHLPNMGAEGIYEFIKWFYGQVRKEGLVIDVRANGGGNVSQMVLNRLNRELLATRYSRTEDTANTYPYTCFVGHMVCVLDANSASDGDIFPAMFKKAGLGPLIGKRSWGGVTGITNRGTLVDGGVVNVPEFGFLSAEGEWIIEGHGVDPDIVVDNDPQSVLDGKDPQLERAVQEVLKAMEANPKKLPPRPEGPVKTE